MVDPLNRFRLDGRVAIVTGASSGLGEQFARTLHAVGADVVLAARRIDRLAELSATLPGSLAVPCDISDSTDRVALVERTVSAFGQVDVLVNNAGVTFVGGIESEGLDDFERVISVNLTAAWHLTKLVGEHMVAQQSGAVINIASILGLVGATPMKQAGYAASKGALVNMTRELALQWARKGIRVNVLCPGWFATEMTEGLMTDERSRAFVLTNSPIQRVGAPEELDGGLLLLASAAGSFITGQCLVIDGGWTAR